MSYLIRHLAGSASTAEKTAEPVYMGIRTGTGLYHILALEDPDVSRFSTREEAENEMAVIGRFLGAMNLAVEAEGEAQDAQKAEEIYREILLSAITKAEKFMPESGLFTLEEMSALRHEISKVAPWLGLKALCQRWRTGCFAY